MEAESAPLLNAWIGPMTTFMGGVLLISVFVVSG